jgi:hypothetical protein
VGFSRKETPYSRYIQDKSFQFACNTEVIYVIVQGLLKGFCMMDYNINLLGINQSMKFKTALHAGLF